MEKEITVLYRIANQDDHVQISYLIETLDGIQTITCKIKQVPQNIPQWLQLRTFQLKSELMDNGSYTPLFMDNMNIKNVDTAMFIDKAYSEIMEKEKFRLIL